MTMTFSADYRGVEGNKRVVGGTFTMDSGDSTGVIITGLRNVEFTMVSNKTAARAVQCEKNTDGSGRKLGSVKISVGTAGDDGWWLAIGY